MRTRVLISVCLFLVVLAAVGMTLSSRNAAPGVPTMVVRHKHFRQRVTAEGNLEAVTSTALAAPTDGGRPQKIAWLIGDGARVEEGDVVIRFDPTDFERERDTGRDELSSAGHRLHKSEVERDATLKNLDRDAELSKEEAGNARDFMRADDQVYSRIEIVESEIDTELADERASHAERTKDVRNRLSKTDLELLGIERKKADLKISQAEDGLRSLQVTAPHGGIVVFERDWRGNIPRVGEVAWPGRPLASLPGLDEMVASVFVLEADAGGLAPGQTAEVILEAHPGRTYAATVKSVDPIAQRRIRWVPVQYFRTVLEFEELDLRLMKPGQRVRADIIITEEASVIAIPRQAVSTVDGRSTVRRFADGKFETVEVELGAAAISRVVVTKGLAEGDTIALGDIAAAAADSQPDNGPVSLGGDT